MGLCVACHALYPLEFLYRLTDNTPICRTCLRWACEDSIGSAEELAGTATWSRIVPGERTYTGGLLGQRN